MKIKTGLQLAALVPIVLTILVVMGLSFVVAQWVEPGVGQTVTTIMAVFFGVVALLMGWALYAAGRILVERVRKLEDLAHHVKDGRLDEVTPLAGEDEIAHVSEALHAMIERIREYSRVLEDRDDLKGQLETAKGQLENVAVELTVARESAELLRTADIDVADGLERLHRAQEMLVHHERMNVLGQMFAGISHGVNGQLTTILSAAEVALAHPEQIGEQSRKDFAMIRQAADEVRKQFQGLLRFYLLPGSATESVNLNGVLDEAVSISAPKWQTEAQVRGAQITIEKVCPENLTLSANRLDLTQLLVALIFNAVEAMPTGGTIRIEAKQGSPATVSIAVADEGEGMDEDVRQRCCRPFFSTKEGGGGIGLALCAGIVEQHGGRLGIMSEKGRGTTVLIELPAARRAAPAKRTQVPLGRPLPRNLRILLVEDEPWTSDILARGLKAEGHQVTVAANGRDGLEAFKSARFDVVITDRAMPKMTGDELASAVKASAPYMPVAMLTGFGDIINAQGVRPMNVDVVIGKPVTLMELTHILGELVTFRIDEKKA